MYIACNKNCRCQHSAVDKCLYFFCIINYINTWNCWRIVFLTDFKKGTGIDIIILFFVCYLRTFDWFNGVTVNFDDSFFFKSCVRSVLTEASERNPYNFCICITYVCICVTNVRMILYHANQFGWWFFNGKGYLSLIPNFIKIGLVILVYKPKLISEVGAKERKQRN